MRAWLFRDKRHVEKLGEKKCPWSVGWIDPDGIKRTKRIGSKTRAETFARRTEGELAAGMYQTHSRKTWKDFRAEYESKIIAGISELSQITAKIGLDNFQRIAKPRFVSKIKTATVDGYIQKRRLERGQKRGSLVSPATLNRELAGLRTALNVAKDWGYTTEVPKIRFAKVMVDVPRFATQEHFAAIYTACECAQRPREGNVEPVDWWRALIVTAYMTGWRIQELLLLRRDNIDFSEGVAKLRPEETKGKRGERVPLHPIVTEHLQKIPGFSVEMFPIPGSRRMLWTEFHRIQKEAGINLACDENHEHTDACHFYGFHDLRRAFATENAESLTSDALQGLMRHKSYTTTQKYIAMAGQLKRSIDKLHVPDLKVGAS